MIGAALDVVTEFVKARLPDDHILKVLEDVRRKPDLYDDPEHAAQPLAQAVKAHRKEQRKKKQREAVRDAVRDEPLEAPIWGEDLIDPEAIQQLRDAMRLPATVAGALMPDAHIGYGIPIGGVVALDNAVAPYMVGVDIACFHGDTLVQTIDGHAYPIAELAKRREQFGVWTCTSEGKVEAGWASA
ncbi:MAG: hypothetical protein GVY18_00940, partial [Bacteroidetes bacterium]|nr:hypothetical protein [Bacteroidota bacterium]